MARRKPETKATSFRLTLDALRILDELARRQGLTLTGALEVLLRNEARREGIPIEQSPRSPHEPEDCKVSNSRP